MQHAPSPAWAEMAKSLMTKRLELWPPLAPMEAQSVERMPRGDAWQYEPKWDGFRSIVFGDESGIELQSKSGQPLTRYFPELVEIYARLPGPSFVLDGE